MNTLEIIILSAYTLVYVVVFFIQKSSIDSLKKSVDSQNAVITSMKSFVEIFDLDKIKQYVKVNEETVMLKAANLIADDEKLNEIALQFTKKHAQAIKDAQMEKLGDQYKEMSIALVELIKMIHPKDRERFINEKLESCKHIFIPLLDKLGDSKP